MQQIDQPRQAGIFVRKARIAQGLTQRQLAHRAGVSERLVLALELGDATGIRLDKLMAVLNALNARLFASEDAGEAQRDVQPTISDSAVEPSVPTEEATDYWDLFNDLMLPEEEV